MPFCKKCGLEYSEGDSFCEKCGRELRKAPQEKGTVGGVQKATGEAVEEKHAQDAIKYLEENRVEEAQKPPERGIKFLGIGVKLHGPEEKVPITTEEKGSGSSGLLIGLVLILIIGGVGYYGYSQYMQRQAFEKVQITPSGYRVASIGLTSASIELDFTAYNPGDRTATLDRLEYQIYVNNQFLVDGAVPNRYDLYSHQTRTITTRASISYLNLGRGVWEALTSKKAQLRITGVAHIDTLIGTYDYPFERVL